MSKSGAKRELLPMSLLYAADAYWSHCSASCTQMKFIHISRREYEVNNDLVVWMHMNCIWTLPIYSHYDANVGPFWLVALESIFRILYTKLIAIGMVESNTQDFFLSIGYHIQW